MSTLIKRHPSLTQNQNVVDICKPLKSLGIGYFAHVQIDDKNRFSALATSAGFTEHYLKNEYYNVDIHMAQNTKLGSYVLWDMIERKGLSAKMHAEAAAFGVEHTFTIIEKDKKTKNYYHFASSTKSLSINQTYLSNLELLKLFIQYFNEKVKNSTDLSLAYQLKFSIASDAEGYQLSSDTQETKEKNQQRFLKNISAETNVFLKNPITIKNFTSLAPTILINPLTKQPIKLTLQQKKCLHLLVLGNTNKQIANYLNLSIRTVENYFDRIRTILDCRTSKELIALYYAQIKNLSI